MLSSKAKRNISRIIPFGLIWFVSGIVFYIVETAARGGLDQHSSTAIEIDYKILLFGTLANTMLGLFVGIVEVLYLNRVFAKKSLEQVIHVLNKHYSPKYRFTISRSIGNVSFLC